MPRYECDLCGACCRGYLIVEADAVDMLRETRLIDADPRTAGKSLLEVLDNLNSDIGRCLTLKQAYSLAL